MSDGQVKRTMPRALISLLITLAIGAVWFYISLPAINLHNTSFYSFVFILLLVYILVSMIVMGIDTGKQEVHLRDYLSFAKNQCKIVVIVVVALAAIFVVGQILSAPFSAPVLTTSCWMLGLEILPPILNRCPMTRSPCWTKPLPACWGTGSWANCPTWSASLTSRRITPKSIIRDGRSEWASLEYGDFFKLVPQHQGRVAALYHGRYGHPRGQCGSPV